MPTFEFQTKDGRTFELDAADQDAAVKAWGSLGMENSVPRGGYVGATVKGAAQAGASMLGTGLDVAEGIGNLPGSSLLPQPFAGAAGIASVIPSDWRKSIEDFSNEPYTPGYETPGRIGYVGASLAPIGGAVPGAVRGAKAAGEIYRATPEIVKHVGHEVVMHQLGIPSWLRPILRSVRKGYSDYRAGQAAERAAEKPPALPEKAPAQPPAAATPKPRVRVKAQTREAKPDERPAIED